MGKIKHMTPKQREIHEMAVKLRKMTDEQLIAKLSAANGVTCFLEDLERFSPHGLGAGTFAKLRNFAKLHGYI